MGNDVAFCGVIVRWARLARLSDACLTFASELILRMHRVRVVFVRHGWLHWAMLANCECILVGCLFALICLCYSSRLMWCQHRCCIDVLLKGFSSTHRHFVPHASALDAAPHGKRKNMIEKKERKERWNQTKEKHALNDRHHRYTHWKGIDQKRWQT